MARKLLLNHEKHLFLNLLLKRVGKMNLTIKDINQNVTIFFQKISQDQIFSMAAALAYSTALSLAPLLILLLAFLSSFSFGSQQELMENVKRVMGSDAAQAFALVLQNINSRPDLKSFADLWGTLTLIFSSSFIFTQLQSSLNIIFETKSDTNDSNWWSDVRIYLVRRLVCFAMVLGFIFISIASMIASSAFSLFITSWWGEALHFLGTLGVYMLLFFAIFKWMPDKEVRWPISLRGAALTALFFVIGKSLIGLYIGRTALASTYGAASSLLILLIWAYYSSLILLFGAELTATMNQKIPQPAHHVKSNL